MKMSEALDLWEKYQKDILGRSENTIKNYISDVNQFAKMEHIDSVDTSREEIEHYLSSLCETGRSEATRSRKITAIQMFYSFLHKSGYIEEDPSAGIAKPKIPKKVVKVMDDEEVKDVLSAAENEKKNKDYFRNMTLIYLLFSTGLRRNELVNVKLDDVSIKDNSLLVREGKGSKQRVVYFNDTMKALLSEYIAGHRPMLKYADKSEYLFPSNCHEKLGLSTVNMIVNKVFTDAGVKDKGYTGHSTRKVFASKVYDATKDIVTVQQLLGHTNPQTTMRYVMVAEERKKNAAQLVNF